MASVSPHGHPVRRPLSANYRASDTAGISMLQKKQQKWSLFVFSLFNDAFPMI
jgi:hypothetical protein